MQGVNGETFQIAPTNQGLSTPTQTTPSVAPVQPVTPNTPPPTTNVTPTPEVAPTPVTPTAVKTPEEIRREEISAQNKATLEQNKQKFELAREDNAIKTEEANNKLANDETAIYNTLNSG